MFNKEFYPTPKWLIKKMLDSIDIKKVKYILEPSAGKGDIIDEIKEKYENCYGYRYSKSERFYIIFLTDRVAAGNLFSKG